MILLQNVVNRKEIMDADNPIVMTLVLILSWLLFFCCVERGVGKEAEHLAVSTPTYCFPNNTL